MNSSSYRTPSRSSVSGNNACSGERLLSSANKNSRHSTHVNVSTTPNHPSSSQIEQLFRTPNVERYQEQYDLVEKNSPVNATASIDFKRMSIESDPSNGKSTLYSKESKKNLLSTSSVGNKENDRRILLSMVEMLFDDDDDVKSIPKVHTVSKQNRTSALQKPEDDNNTNPSPQTGVVSDLHKSTKPHVPSSSQHRWNDSTHQLTEECPPVDNVLFNSDSDKIVFQYESDEETPISSSQLLKGSTLLPKEDTDFPSSILTSEFFYNNNIPVIRDPIASSIFSEKRHTISESNKARNAAFEEKYNHLLSTLLAEVDKFKIDDQKDDDFPPVQTSASSFSLSLQQELFTEEVQNQLSVLRKISKQHFLSRDHSDVGSKLQKFLLLPVDHIQSLALKQVCCYYCLSLSLFCYF
jgi:hypothetical protein